MNGANCKKAIYNVLKQKINCFNSNKVDFVYSKGNIEIFHKDERVGEITIKLLKGSHIPQGAILAITISSIITGGEIWRYLNELNLSYRKKGIFHDFVIRLLSSNMTKYSLFRHHGIVSFYPNEDIESKIHELLESLMKFFINRLAFLLSSHLLAIEDIFNFPKDYAYPTTIALIICHINNREDLIEEVTRRAKDQNFMDSSPSKIKEVVEKLNEITI